MAAMISDNDKRGEAQVLAAFDDFRDAVDSDNVIKATFEGLRSLKDPQEVSRLREKPLEEILG